MSNLLHRLESLLSTPTPAARVVVPAEHRRVQDALSGALGEKVIVRPWIDGSLAVVVPVRAFVPNGLRMVESAVPGHRSTLTGSAHAVAGAERRLGKLIGEGWGTRLVDFDPDTNAAVFTVFTHA